MATFSMEFAEYRPLPENLVDTLRWPINHYYLELNYSL